MQAAVTQLTEASVASTRSLAESEAEAARFREKAMKYEAKLTTLVQERAELQSQLSEVSAELNTLRKRHEKVRKERKVTEEALKTSRAEGERTSLRGAVLRAAKHCGPSSTPCTARFAHRAHAICRLHGRSGQIESVTGHRST
ncbi:hypothetical protein EON66_02030 [archaeon]|nr:MAG: hypothetical protein EON66_02030 [archaeon]